MEKENATPAPISSEDESARTHNPDGLSADRKQEEDPAASSIDEPPQHVVEVPDSIAAERGLAQGHEEKMLVFEPEIAGGSGRLARRFTGPRTTSGKTRSSKNALRHGIFASSLLPWESRKQFTKLVRGLYESFGPEGELEESLVHQLAHNYLRHRRLLLAESGFIHESALEEQDAENRKAATAWAEGYGLIDRIGLPPNRYVIERVVWTLKELRKCIAQVNRDQAVEYFEQLYGRDCLLDQPLATSFGQWLSVTTSESDNSATDDSRAARCRQVSRQLLQQLNEEIRRLERIGRAVEQVERRRKNCEAKTRLLLSASKLERILGYEVHLDRQSERILNQLERAQRMRLGQALPPPFKVELSS